MIQDTEGNLVTTPEALKACWRAQIESGRPMHPDALHQLCIYTELVNYRCPDENILRSLPALRDLEASFRRCKAQRASGPDLIPPELCHYAARWMTHYLAPLYMKCALYQAEPIQWKGGVLREIWKRKGPMVSPSSYRGILVSSHLAKCFHNIFRAPTLSWHAETADSLQFGGLPGKGVDMACHTIQTFMSLTRQTKKSCGLFFLDIQSAYYRLLRSLAVGPTCTQAELLEIFQAMDLSEDVLYELATAAFSPSALEVTGCPHWLREFGATFHRHTWFHIRSDAAITETLRGTRPGDGYADLLFNLVIGRILRALEVDLAAQGIQTQILWNGSQDLRATPGEEVTLNVVWADDIAVMVHHDSASGLLDAVSLVFESYIDRLARHGLCLNYGSGKTEALILVRGKGSRQVRQQIFQGAQGRITVETCAAGPIDIRLVSQYKHLGMQIHANGSLMPELRVRVGCANSAFNRDRRAVYQNTDLSIAKRVQLLRACVLSILFWNAGVWPPLQPKELKYFNGAFRRLLLRLLHRDFDRELLCTWSDARLLGYLGVLPIIEQIRLLRLGHYSRLTIEGPPFLWALLANERCWLDQLAPDFVWLWANSQSLKFRPDPNTKDGSEFWHSLIRTNPRSWKGLLKKAYCHARIQLSIRSEVDAFHRDIASELRSFDPSLQPCPVYELVEEETVFPCIPCGRCFATKQGWAIHTFRVHGRKAPARYLVDQPTCACCLRTFLNPSRLYLHLRHSADCFHHLRGLGISVDPLPGRGSASWRNDPQFIFLPPQQAVGPTMAPVDQPRLGTRMAVSPHEADLLAALMDLEAQPAFCHTIEGSREFAIAGIKECLRSWPASLEEMRTTLQLWAAILRQEHAHRRRLLPATMVYWCQIIAEVEQQLYYRWLCPELLPVEPLVKRGLSPEDRLRHLPEDALQALSAPLRTLGTTRPIFVHFFSGRRREQDFQFYMEQIHWDPWSTPLVISLDIVVDRVNGNCMDPKVRSFWLGAMRAGYIAGVLAGPPCESWSVSRERWHTDHKGPRPLRTAASPWTLISLLLREARQVYAANSLLMFSIAAFIIQWMLGKYAMLEHPAPPDPERFPNAPSIWNLSVLDLLTKLPGICRNHIFQGHHGAKSPKPTCLMLAHGPMLSQFARPFRTRMDLPPALRMGKVEGGSGEYNTASLKEYPAELNILSIGGFNVRPTNPILSPLM